LEKNLLLELGDGDGVRGFDLSAVPFCAGNLGASGVIVILAVGCCSVLGKVFEFVVDVGRDRCKLLLGSIPWKLKSEG
jgi:hypothetical protein